MMTRTFLAHRMSRLAIVAAITGTVSFAECARAKEPAAPTTPGLAAEAPADGPSVKVDGGYMVPYTEKIPGTDITFEMVPVPGGEFVMGSPPTEAERADDEGPQVRVKVEPFWIGKCEVTWGEYKSFMAMYDAFKKLQMLSANGAPDDGDAAADKKLRVVKMHAWNGKVEDEWKVDAVTAPTPLYDSTFTYSAGEEPNQPAVTITPFAAKQYTKWLSGITGNDYRLPSEAEWEYAARAGSTTAYSFGDDASQLQDYAWIEDNADFQTHPVGTKKPNAWGLCDMHGNAAEWTLDEYAPDAYAKLGADTVDAKTIVRSPTKVYPRVIRGGSWYEQAPAARSAARHKSEEREWKISDPNIPKSPWWYTEEAAMAVGMRVMRPLKPLSADEKKQVWEADVDDIREDVAARLREGRGALGMADETLPDAVQAAEELDKTSKP
ncbi:MAG: formylglycine-generating enzyme family protein [Planctomycetes bacterium]|nr:formylglycine-generating enzyme family protein [Planctomycetota bacterium]